MKLCNYSMNVGLLGVAREMEIAIKEYLLTYDKEGKFYYHFGIEVEHSPWASTAHVYFAWEPTKNEIFNFLFAPGVDFNVKIENIEHHFYILKYPSKIQIYFNPK